MTDGPVSAGPCWLVRFFFFTERKHVPVAEASRRAHLRPDLLLPSHLQLADPGAMPVGEARPLHKELPLWVALEGGVGQWIVWFAIGARGHFSWQRGLAPRPVQYLLDLAFEGRALEAKKEGGEVVNVHLLSKEQYDKFWN